VIISLVTAENATQYQLATLHLETGERKKPAMVAVISEFSVDIMDVIEAKYFPLIEKR
jgi:hypothetical protein